MANKINLMCSYYYCKLHAESSGIHLDLGAKCLVRIYLISEDV